MHASYLLNRLPTTAIGGKPPLEIWLGGAARDNGSLRVFGCPAYVDVKKDMLDSKVNKLVFLGSKEGLLQIMGSEKQRVYLEQTCHIG